MADIRINALANTATSAASDDYLALDGAAQGTRKILATNIANNVTDVILGTSGPSVKSSLSARAPRQGLVFDGTAGATVTSVPAFGTADYSIAAWLVWSGSSAQTIVDGSSSVAFFVNGSGGVAVFDRISSSTKAITANGVVTAGKPCFVTYTRAGQIYVNGLASGAVVADTSNYTGTIGTVGQNYDGSQRFSGFLAVNIYNRSLSASEVVALYEAGAPAGADYNNASSTNIITGDAWYTTVQSGTAISSGVATITTPGNLLGRATAVTVGKRYRVSVNITASTGGAVVRLFEITTGTNRVIGSAAGTNTLEFTATSADQYFNISAGTATFNTISLIPLGLLLAPDAAQAGGGLTWYDTSGNAANITLPASGVRWNVPSSQVLGGNWTTSGNLTVSGLSNMFGTANGGTYLLTPGTAASTGSLTLQGGNGSGSTAGGGVIMYGGSHASAPGWVRVGLAGTSKFAVNTSGLGAGTDVFTVDQAGNLTVSGTGTSALTSSSAKLVVGTTSATSTNSFGVPQITAESDIYSSIASIAHNDTNGNHGFLAVGKSRGTKASPTILADGDVFGELSFVAYDGAAYRTSGQIRSVIAGTPGASDLPTALDFRVAPDASATPATAMRIAPTGNVLLKSDGVDSSNGKLQLATHTNSAGGIGFGTDIALYRAGGNTLKLELGVSAGVLWFDNGGLGTGGARILGSSGALTITSNGSNSLYLQTGGSTALTLDSSLNATFAGNVTAIKAGTAFYSIESTVNGALSEVIVKGKNSTGTAREARLGLNKYADDVFSIYDGTTERFRLGLTNGDATFAGKTYTAAGTAAAPAISFSGDTDSGFYNAGGNQVSLACGGGQIWNTTVNGLSMASGKDIYLGNAYQAATVAPTGYVTIKDSTGTVYKVCVLL